MKVLVTGGTGFVGPKIVQRLVDDGHTVRVLEHSAGSSAALPNQDAVQGGMTDAESLRRAVEGQEVVVHLVALLAAGPEEFRRVMEEGTRDLIAAARDAGTTIVDYRRPPDRHETSVGRRHGRGRRPGLC